MQMQEQSEQYEQQNQNQQQQHPDQIEVDGQEIYIKGLDYKLLSQQNTKQKPSINDIKQKLSLFSDRLNKTNPQKVKEINIDESYQNDPIVTNLIRILGKKDKSEPLININTFYKFDTKYHFGSLLPQIVTRKSIKTNQSSTFFRISKQNLQEFRRLQTQISIQQANNKQNEQQAMGLQDDQNDKDSDDIFNDGPKQSNNIQIGRTLNFGIDETDIFNKYNKKQQIPIDIQKQEQNDKYEFMRKKVKISNEDLNNGYDECYISTGPSFEQMKEMKKLGIQIFGEMKEFKGKQRKINIGKDYHKIMGIIEKNKKA